jgi:uncharacterized membrane protein YgdD (TMEM256/DUF423 family)
MALEPWSSGRLWLGAGGFLAALAVAAGALGAHALSHRLQPTALQLWESAARYLMYGGLGLIAAGLSNLRQASPFFDVAGKCLLAGSLLFSGTAAALALGGPRWLGAVTPLGGVLLIFGFLALAAGALRG